MIKRGAVMKSILLSKQPKIVANVLNGISKILVCKKFPKDYVGWVYIYCTKRKPYIYKELSHYNEELNKNLFFLSNTMTIFGGWEKGIKTSSAGMLKDIYGVEHYISSQHYDDYNGKVIARFWCDRVEEIKTKILPCNDPHKPATFVYITETLNKNELLTKSCLNFLELNKYLFHIGDDWSASKVCGYAIHISKLEVFDRPLYLDDFTRPAKCMHCEKCEHKNNKICDKGFVKMFDKAPRNYCYIEG